jgi:GT2 family glycosyltransferase
MPPVDCSILIPILNEERYIEQSVDAMRRQQFAGTLEFVFADGGSSDRTRELLEAMARRDSRIRIFENPNRSVSSGLNVALRNARGRWIARMDAHTEYPENYVALGVARLEAGDTRWVSGPQVPRGDNPVSRAVALALGSPLGRGRSRKWGVYGRPAEEEFELDSGVFAGVWERSTLLEYCGWDERWPRNSDSEMAGRFLGRGERLICVPAMGACYVPRGTLRGLWRQYLDYGEFREKTAVRHPHTLRRSLLLAPALVLVTAMAMLAPRPFRALAQAGLAAYAASLGMAGVAAARNAQPRRDAALVPAVLAVMHYGHGAGFWRGMIRNGPPIAALAQVFGRGSPGLQPPLGEQPVFSPSLTQA